MDYRSSERISYGIRRSVAVVDPGASAAADEHPCTKNDETAYRVPSRAPVACAGANEGRCVARGAFDWTTSPARPHHRGLPRNSYQVASDLTRSATSVVVGSPWPTPSTFG